MQKSKSELEYAGEEWLFPLRAEYSAALNGDVQCQASIKRGDNIYPSPVYTIRVDTSIIKDNF